MFAHRTYARREADGEQGYMGSAADLMTGLLFVFIIMVAFLALQTKSEQEKSAQRQRDADAQTSAAQKNAAVSKAKADAEAAKRAAEEARARKAEEEAKAARDAARKQQSPLMLATERDPRGVVTALIGGEIAKILPTIKVDPASGVITLPEELLFDRGSAQLKPSVVGKLAQVSQHLAVVLKCFVSNQRIAQGGFGGIPLDCPQNPDGQEIETIFIEGHTDSVPRPAPGGNLGLSLDRAISVNSVLVGDTPLASFQNKDAYPIFSYSAYGESRPLIKSDTTDARNRRVDLRIVLTYRPPSTGGPIDTAQSALRN